MSGSTTPYPIGEVKDLQEALSKIQQYFDEMYQERLGGALVGDVFQVGADEILTLNIGVGLQKIGAILSVMVNPADAITAQKAGLGISDATKTKHGALPILSDNATDFLNGKGAWVNPGIQSWPIGSVFISVVATNPATLLGFGTWAAFGTGRFLVGLDAGDVDFDTAEKTGGAKTHKHSVDVGATTSGAPSTTVNAVTIGGATAVGDGTHTHSVDPAAVGSTTVSNVPPYIVCYFWKRTA